MTHGHWLHAPRGWDLCECPSKPSTRRLERVLDHVGGELFAHVLAGADRERIVHATSDADILLLL